MKTTSITIRGIPVFILGDAKVLTKYMDDTEFRAMCYQRRHPGGESENITYQYRALGAEWDDDILVGAYESEMELSDLGLDPDAVLAFIDTLPPLNRETSILEQTKESEA